MRLWRITLPAGLVLAAVGLVVLAATSIPTAEGNGITVASSGAIKTQVVKTAAGWELMRGGKPFFVKGVGGDYNKQKLVEAGGNSFRTWGVGKETQGLLDEANKLSLGVCLGIWLGNSPGAINGAIGEATNTFMRYKDHPATLIWALGNEMEGGGNDPKLWQAIDAMAVAAHKTDPNHPTMTVIAEMGGQKIQNIHKYCPNIDIIGINSYAGCDSIPKRYRAAGGTKPYIITEFGPPGQWECAKTQWGSAIEMTSTEKAEHYRKSWTDGIVAAKGLSLGGFAFIWGNKNEATPTWFGMVLPDNSRLGCVDAMQKEWTGKAPANLCPIIRTLKLAGPTSVKPGTVVKASVDATDPEKDRLTYQWILRGDSRDNKYGGGAASASTALANAVLKPDAVETDVKLPDGAGYFRLFCYIHDGKGNAAVGNICIQTK
jgi:hypothetical protein